MELKVIQYTTGLKTTIYE